MYIAGRGTIEETNTSRPPTSTTPLRPSARRGRAAASTSSAGSPSRSITRGSPEPVAADRREVGDRALLAHGLRDPRAPARVERLDEDVDAAAARQADLHRLVVGEAEARQARRRRPARTSSLWMYTAGSTQPPVTEPATSPVSDTAITLPGRRGAERSRATTVPRAARRPSRIHPSSVGSTSRTPVTSRSVPGPDPTAAPNCRQYTSRTRSASRGGTGVRFKDVEQLEEALAGESYLADRGLAVVRLPGAHAAPAAAARGRAGRRQDRDRPHARAGARRRADPPPVLRGHRRRAGALRVGLLAPAPLRAHDPGGDARPRATAPPSSTAPSSSSSGRCCARCGRGGRGGAADRRARPRRRGVRGVPARGAGRLRGDDPGDRDGHGRAAAGRGAHLEPHPRAARRPEAPLPLPLDRLPRAWSARWPSSACGRPRRRRRSPGRWPTVVARLREHGPGQAARPGGGDRLGARARGPRHRDDGRGRPPTRRWAGWSRTATTSRWCGGCCRSCWGGERPARGRLAPRARRCARRGCRWAPGGS